MLSEESLELIVQDHLAELEWQAGHGPDFAPGSGERDTWNDIVLRGRLRNAVRNLNPDVPEEYLDQAIGEVITPKSQSAIAENRRIHQILVEGYRGIEYIDHEGNVQNPTIYFLSSQPHKNDYLSLNQVTVANLDGERRFDVVCYVNGMPLAFIELKKTGANTSVEGAYNQLQTYVQEFGMAFRFANIVIPSDDISAKYGTPFTPWNHFAPWNVDEDGSPVDPNNMVVAGEPVTQLDLLLDGLFNVERFGQLYSDFTAFDDTAEGLVMRIAKPHQLSLIHI